MRERYRRWLFAYPRDYRRDELLDTLLDAAAPGRTRPTAREAADLVRHGLRARLGRPASRSVVVWATLTAVICGLFTAAFAVRAAWETARPLPRAAEATAMLAEIVPGEQFAGVADAPAMFVVYGEPLRWAHARALLTGDGAEYAQAGVGGGMDGVAEGGPDATVELAVRNLRAHGWTVYPPTKQDMYGCVGPPCDTATIPQSTTVVAARGDTVFTLEVNGDGSFMSGVFQRATPWAAWPAGVVGFLLGGVAAFLAFAWASRRTTAPHPARGAVTVLLGVALLFWWGPTTFTIPLAAAHHAAEPHPSWHPMWEWLGQPTFSLLFLIGTAAAALGLALAALPTRERERVRARVS